MSFLKRINQTHLDRSGATTAQVIPRGISHRPDLAGRVHILSQQGNDPEAIVTSLDSYVDYAAAYKVYVWVRKAIKIYAESIGSLRLRVLGRDGDEIIGHPLTDLFAHVNDSMGPEDLWEQYCIFMLLGGEAFLEFVDGGSGTSAVPLEVWPRRPDLVGVRPDKSEDRALFPRPAGYVFGDEENIVPPENMWHGMFRHPTNPWRGLAPINAVRHAIVLDMFAISWSQNFLRHGARPDWALVSPEGLTRTERQELEMEMLERFSGTDKNHLPIILEQGMTDVKVLSHPPKDIEWLEQRKLARDEVGGLFGIPDEVMGYGRDTYENMDAAHRWLWLITLKPFVDRRDVGLTHYFTKIRPHLSSGERLATDLTKVGALQVDLAPLIDQAWQLFQMGVPFNTLDSRFNLGIGSVPAGNVGWVPVNLAPATTAVAEAQEETDGEEDKGIRFGGATHKRIWERHALRLQRFTAPMQRELKRQLQMQQNRVLRAFREQTRALGDSEAKAQQPFPNVDSIFDVNREIEIFSEVFRVFFNNAVVDFAEASFDEVVEAAGSQAIGGVFDVTDPFIQGAIQEMNVVFAMDINQRTRQLMDTAIREIVETAAEEGASIPQIQQAVHDQISSVYNVRKSDFETERIARTEMNKAANGGRLAGWDQSGVVEGKSWLAALDDRTRDSHIRAHTQYQGSPIPLAADFEVGSCSGPAPTNTGCAEEDANCRCTMTAKLKK